jgi:hypothetical protein
MMPASYTVGGTLSGLSGGSLVLQNNGSDDLSLTANGSFAFSKKIASGSAYLITIKTQPTGATCSLIGGTGTVGAGNVSSVAVNCTPDQYLVGGQVSGLRGLGLVLQNNRGDDLPVGADGSFAFATSLANGSSYAVSIKTRPSAPAQECTVSNGSGTVAGADVTNVAVTCTCESVLLAGTNATESAKLRTSVLGTNAFCTVDFMNTATATPTLAMLRPYSAVLVYNDTDPSDAQATALGNAVADYYDAGGRVVISLFGHGGYAVTGRFGTVSNGYMLMTPATVTKGTESLGMLVEPQSPLLMGVTRLTGNQAWRGTQALANGATVVAKWSSGSNLVVRGTIKGRPRADLNLLPLENGGAQPQALSGDLAILVRNALLFK